MTIRDLEAIVNQRREAVGGDDVTFSFAGQEFSFPHPLLASDSWKDGLADITSDVELGQYVLGEQYEQFIELGGRSSYLAILMDDLRREVQDEDAEGRPTRLPTSSRARQKRQKRT
ncbi:hypothetical protein JNUCC0626_20060 [Lentzea sp. JNUCC 0626]|uniref:hypothetical protein n=1 Tax=Lentzea sp. JNUCC 0626 TaxID=3367513 RepID=UPI00374876B5